jgi:PHS family inorganic phosphate transporter-like MFS transporter
VSVVVLQQQNSVFFFCISLPLPLVILGTLASALAFPVGPISIATVLAVLRFVLGIGIGGEYPLSATITAE